MAVESQDGRRGLGALLGELAEGSTTLLRDEVRLARIETASAFGAVARGSTFIALGAVLALLGSLALLAGVVLLVGDQWLAADRYWLAALIVVAITGGLAAWFAKRGMALLSPSQLAPNETAATLQEDKEWLKRQTTSVATSR